MTTNQQTPATGLRSAAASRRGVLLLVVLSLLVLFALIGITFVLVAGQHLKKTKMALRNEQYGGDPRRLTDAVLAQIVRGTTDPHSVLRGHSLLEDLYGNDGARGEYNSWSYLASNQLVDLTLPMANLTAMFPAVVTATQLQTPGFYNGCVLTMLDGPAAGKSTRIVGWGYSGTNYTIRVMAFDGVSGPLSDVGRFIVNGRPFNGTGFGFNPTAIPTGAMAAATLLNAAQDVTPKSGSPITVPYALLPNPIFADPSRQPDFWFGTPGWAPMSVQIFGGVPYPQFGGIGGADEDYDAPDPQNMLLGYMPLNPTDSSQIIPSLHRPDLLAYMAANTDYGALPPSGGYGTDFDVKRLLDRQTSMRPTPADHPQFANPSFNRLIGPWDVDNDGDGIADSVWVDLGLPVETAPDGRVYKPMVAILCLDLDGRLNVNAHGNVAQVDSYYFDASPTGAQASFQTTFPVGCFPTGAMPILSRGQGYGPAEINLYPLFQPLGTLAPPNIVLPGYASLLAGRYAEPNSNLSSVSYDSRLPATTVPYAPYPGITAWDDRLADLKFNDYTYPSSPVNLSGFASPHNLSGKGFPFLDVRGTPLWPYCVAPNDLANSPYNLTDDPYELDLSRRKVRASKSPAASTTPPASPDLTLNPHDSPFMAVELERALRIYDADAAQLPDRLAAILNAGGGEALTVLRNMITTDSFDLPSPSIQPTRELRSLATGYGIVPHSISDLVQVRLIAGGVPMANVPAEMHKMLPSELAAGLRMDVNRPFGNAHDDNGNGVIDEPAEQLPEASYWWNAARRPNADFDLIKSEVNNGIDVDDSGSVGTPDKQLARQLMARHLYVLMMLLKDAGTNIDFDKDGTNSPGETERGIAQWAVNVVDFRDRDSIMTPFEFDFNPFDGWDVDGVVNGWQGIPSTDDANPSRGLVWGCERPELLISETLAYHDRRTEDRSDEAFDISDPNNGAATQAGTTQETMPTMDDNDFDQSLRPFGPFFVELYNPWNTPSSTINANGAPTALESPGEFHVLDAAALAANQGTGVVLSKASAVGGSPVWRMAVVKGPSLPLDPDNPDPTPPVFNKAHVDRAIYFRDPTGVTDLTNAVSYFPDTAAPPAPVLPGRYALVGSAGLLGLSNTATGVYVNPIGRKTGGTAGDATLTRSIVLSPNANPNTNQVQVVSNFAPSGPIMYPEPASADIKPTVAVVLRNALTSTGVALTSPAQFTASISEPQNGYDALAATAPGAPSFNPAAGAEGSYSSVIDQPLDKLNTNFTTAPNNQPEDGTRSNFAMIHLQRLADPTVAWDAVANPYLTIDSMSVDLTVFNGVVNPADPTDPNVGAPLNAGIASYQRGDAGGLAPLWGRQLLHTALPAAVVPTGGAAHNYPYTLQHTLGYLNKVYGVEASGSAYDAADAPLAGYVGSPKSPFPWLTWNNRPFVGPMELLLVPKSRSSQLLFEYAPLGMNLYDTPVVTAGAPGLGHLLDFFQIPTATPRAPSPSFFEYLQVPSRFAGTETVLNPQSVPATGLPNEQALFSFYRSPFSKVSNYRDPGRVNINTIPSDLDGGTPTSSVWNGILNAAPGSGGATPLWSAVFQSRQGAASPFNPANSSSRFANPFRSAAGSSLLLPGTPGTPDGMPNTRIRDEVDVTLMRPLDPDTSDPASLSLFDFSSANPYDNSQLNPYFRIQNLQRMSNLLTTRSNVYAIWVTVGYFEALPAKLGRLDIPSQAARRDAYPDDYALGQEVGSDTGEVKRHRAFYIYDRSIPVGFEPGQDHNFEDGLLLRRFIE